MSEMKFLFLENREHYGIRIETGDGFSVETEFPLLLEFLGGEKKRVSYDIVENGESLTGFAEIKTANGNVYKLEDRWIVFPNSVKLHRSFQCYSGIESPVRLSTALECSDGMAQKFQDYRIVVPGAFYGLNDNDDDGREDYLGTYSQDYRDDRNPGMSVTCYSTFRRQFVSLLRIDSPKNDPTLLRQQIAQRFFSHDTDIGSLGFAPSAKRSGNVILRMDYPFYERESFCLNVDGSDWSAFRPISAGQILTVSYEFFAGTAENLTEASWKTTVHQADRLMTDNTDLPFTLQESMSVRTDLIAKSYREFPNSKGNPAGYFMHFSPRKSLDGPNILEYGFSGAQTLNAYTMLRASRREDKPEWREQALKVIAFFVDHCIHPSGLPYGIYDIDHEKFIYWWTGVLFPFQYARDREELEKYVGWQVVSSLLKIADALRGVEGNYCRTMVEAMNYLLLAYKDEKEAGYDHPKWLNVCKTFCNHLIEIQNSDGSWNRGYTMEGKPLQYPVEWFGKSVLERGSGAIFPCEVLISLYKITNDKKYLDSACAAGDFILDNYVEDVRYVGGLNDTTHIKSVKIDSVGVMFAMRSLLMCFEASHEERYLKGARSAAEILCSWVFVWNVPFAEDTLLGKFGFKTTGWAGCDVIPAAGYVDDEFPEFIPDLMRIAEYVKDSTLGRFAKAVSYGMQHGLSMPQRMYDYALPGVQCEGYMTSLWLSDMRDCTFSGAVAKLKGDDNDTCNGLINAQAIYNLDELSKRYGTIDFDTIIRSFSKSSDQ